MNTIQKGTVIVALDGMVRSTQDSVIESIERAVCVPDRAGFPGRVWFKLHDHIDFLAQIDRNGIAGLALRKRYLWTRFWADMKLFDIPTTVGLRMGALAEADAVSVHLAGGLGMVRAAVEQGAKDDTLVIGISQLSSLTDKDPMRWLGMQDFIDVANGAGVQAVVGRPEQLTGLKTGIKRIMAGVRPAGYAADDHTAPPTPWQAIRKLGADAVVIGRPITQAPDPGAALRAILDEIDG